MHTFVTAVLVIISLSAAVWLYARARGRAIRRVRHLDYHDVARAREAVREPGRRPWHEVRRELGLDEDAIDRAEREEQRRSFAFGNANLANPDVTRQDIDEAADRMEGP